MVETCRYYLQGNCKYGSSCRFAHPTNNSVQGAFGKSPFSAFKSSNNSSSTLLQNSSTTDGSFGVTRAGIQSDLEMDRPGWILSAYGPGRDAPEQLFGGYPREQSFEEARLAYELARAEGKTAEAEQHLNSLYAEAESQIRHALNNLDEAVNFVISAQDKHPNRNDVCQMATNGSSSTANPFGGKGGGTFGNSGTPTQSPFATGANATSVANQSTGASPFGQPANPFGGGGGGSATTAVAIAAPTFGQPTAIGQRPAFGQPAFGQPSVIQSTLGNSGFGQTQPVFGQPSQLSNPWGASPAFAGGVGSSQLQTQSASPFTAFASNTSKQSPFSTLASANTTNGGFAQASKPAFGQPSTIGASASPFAPPAPSAGGLTPFGQPQQGPFASAASGPSPFAQAGQAAGQQVSPFAQPQQSASAFGQPQSSQSPFGTQAQNQGQTAFGQPQNPVGFGAPSNTPSAFGNPAQPQQTQAQKSKSPYAPDSMATHPEIETYSTKNSDGNLATFKTNLVVYEEPQPDEPSKPYAIVGSAPDGSQKKKQIWFPNGAPIYNPETELPANPTPGALGIWAMAKVDNNYTDELVEMFRKAVQVGQFENGILPEIPPKRVFCLWDF